MVNARVHFHLRRWERKLEWKIAWCESGRDPKRHNPSGSTGWLQFMPSTWASTPYGRHSIWLVKWQALAGAWMLRHGRLHEWDASIRCWA